MVRKALALILCTLLGATTWSQAALAAGMKDASPAPDWAATVRQAEVDGFNYVQFRLSDGRKVKGYLTGVHPGSCTVQEKAGTVQVSYGDIQSAKWKHRAPAVPSKYANHALSRPAKYLLIIGIVSAT